MEKKIIIGGALLLGAQLFKKNDSRNISKNRNLESGEKDIIITKLEEQSVQLDKIQKKLDKIDTKIDSLKVENTTVNEDDYERILAEFGTWLNETESKKNNLAIVSSNDGKEILNEENKDYVIINDIEKTRYEAGLEVNVPLILRGLEGNIKKLIVEPSNTNIIINTYRSYLKDLYLVHDNIGPCSGDNVQIIFNEENKDKDHVYLFKNCVFDGCGKIGLHFIDFKKNAIVILENCQFKNISEAVFGISEDVSEEYKIKVIYDNDSFNNQNIFANDKASKKIELIKVNNVNTFDISDLQKPKTEEKKEDIIDEEFNSWIKQTEKTPEVTLKAKDGDEEFRVKNANYLIKDDIKKTNYGSGYLFYESSIFKGDNEKNLRKLTVRPEASNISIYSNQFKIKNLYLVHEVGVGNCIGSNIYISYEKENKGKSHIYEFENCIFDGCGFHGIIFDRFEEDVTVILKNCKFINISNSVFNASNSTSKITVYYDNDDTFKDQKMFFDIKTEEKITLKKLK